MPKYGSLIVGKTRNISRPCTYDTEAEARADAKEYACMDGDKIIIWVDKSAESVERVK